MEIILCLIFIAIIVVLGNCLFPGSTAKQQKINQTSKESNPIWALFGFVLMLLYSPILIFLYLIGSGGSKESLPDHYGDPDEDGYYNETHGTWHTSNGKEIRGPTDSYKNPKDYRVENYESGPRVEKRIQ